MTLEEIKNQVEAAYNIPLNEDGTSDTWNHFPRVNYADLPKELQEIVCREYTPQRLQSFLYDNYSKDDCEKLFKFVPWVSVETILKKMRSIATYTIEYSYSKTAKTKEETLMPCLYENHAAIALSIAVAEIANNPPGSYMPEGVMNDLYFRVINAGNRGLSSSKNDRHEKITTTEDINSATGKKTITTIREKGSSKYALVYSPDDDRPSNKTANKLFSYIVQAWTNSGSKREISFPLQNLVNLGMYADIRSARRGFLIYAPKLLDEKFFYSDGKTSKGGVLIYNYSVTNNQVILMINETMPKEVVAEYFMLFPYFAYSLSNNAFSIIYHIMSIARRNGNILMENNGRFTISLDNIREFLGLPAPEEVKGRKYREKIREPIEAAFEEIEMAIHDRLDEIGEYAFTITPSVDDDATIQEWLSGKIEVQLSKWLAEQNIAIYKKKLSRIKAAETAKLKAEAAEAAKKASRKK